jgi:HSP20 family protein
MNKRIVKRSLAAAAVLAVIGLVGAEAYSAQKQEGASDSNAGNTTEETMVITESDDPFLALHADMMRMQAQMDQLMSANMRQMRAMGMQPTDQSQVTLEDQGDNYVVKADIPGVNENNIKINLDGRLLSLSSQTQGTEKFTSDQGKVSQQDKYVSSYQEAFTLPGPVNASGMKTQFHDNSLTITIPKATS